MKQGRVNCADQIKELAEMINGAAYKEKYMYGVSYLKHVIDAYERECVCRRGSSSVSLVDYRIKSAESIAYKLGKKGYHISCENAINYLSDLAGVRVVCFSVEDVYELEEFLGRRNDIEIVKRKDYIKSPKANGYQSLHLIVEINDPKECEIQTGGEDFLSNKIRIELQLRTKVMHLWAEFDHKQFYKKFKK